METRADYDSIAEAMVVLKENGYTEEFNYSNGTLVASDKKEYKVEDLKVQNVFRFEGVSDPADMSILYALETRDGRKGVLIDAFGVYGDPELEAFMKKMRDNHKSHTSRGMKK